MTGRRRRLSAAVVALAGVLCLASLAPASTDAAWTDKEVGSSGTVTAGTVAPVTAMTCTDGLLAPITFRWTAPAGGLTRTGYRWVVSGSWSLNGTLAANATSQQFASGLLSLGSGTFSLYAVGPGGWESLVKTGSMSYLTGLVTGCSVP